MEKCASASQHPIMDKLRMKILHKFPRVCFADSAWDPLAFTGSEREMGCRKEEELARGGMEGRTVVGIESEIKKIILIE